MSNTVVQIKPHNEHEIAIARIVGRLAVESKLYPTAIEDVIKVLDFAMSRHDSEFLVKYLRWRMDNPIAR